MSASLSLFCLNILIIFSSITTIRGDCIVNIPTDPLLRPTLYKVVGSHAKKINLNANILNYIKLYENQEIEAYCDGEFTLPYLTSTSLYIKCKNYIMTKNYRTDTYIEFYNNHYGQISLECSSIKWKLYEAARNFAWCPTNVTSYVLARPEHSYFAGICYDIYNESFSSVFYTLAAKHSVYMQPRGLRTANMPGLEIKYIKETFGSNRITANDFDNHQFQNWINQSNFAFSSIIQQPKLYSSFNQEFSSLLEFVWWPNLRLNNWRRYETALDHHIESENQAYDILAGVSGAVKAPIIENCQTNYSMKEMIDRTERKIPLYVWNYLQARDESSNEIVIVGFNSPFDDFYSQEEIIFCPDKCQEIPWLKNVSSSFRYRIMGIVFCCDVKDVRSSKRLYGFPEYDIHSEPAEMKPLIPDENEHKDESDDRNVDENEDENEDEHDDEYERDYDE